jgi:hypothetical protein
MAIDEMITSMDKDQYDFKMDIDECITEIDNLEKESKAKNLPFLPGLKL